MLSNFIVSFLCIELSSGFMQSVIYILLYKNSFGPDFYALTFILTLLPSFLFGGKISNLLDGKNGRLILQILSLIVIFIYITSFITKGFINIYVMLFLEAISSLYAVSIYPYIQVFIKSLNLSRTEIVNFAKAESIVGPTSSVIGLGIGSIFVTLNNISYFYLSSIIIISLGIINLNRVMIDYKKENESNNNEISLDRKPHASVFIFFPALFSITTIPFIVVFPVFSIDKFAGTYENYLSPSALVLIARCMGQCLGPFFISNKITSIFFNNKFNIIIAQILFVLFYMCGYISINPFFVFLFIVIAHVIGSIVATICYVGIQKEYDTDEISYASSLQIKYLILSSLILSLTSSRLYIFGGIKPIFFLSIVGIISLILFFYANDISKNDD